MIDELEEEHDLLSDEVAGEMAAGSLAPTSILCIGARNGLDEAAAAMLAHLLTRRGAGARTVPRTEISGRNLASLERQGIALVCLSYVNPGATQHAQRTLRRLRQHFGTEVRMMLGMWAADPSAEAPQELLQATGADLVVTSLRQAVRQTRGGRAGTARGGAEIPDDGGMRRLRPGFALSRRPAAARPRPGPRGGWR